MIDRIFLAHPRSVDESYAEHAAMATRFGATMVVGGVACMVHALIPAIFQRSASTRVKKLYAVLEARQPSLHPPSFTQPEWRPEYEI